MTLLFRRQVTRCTPPRRRASASTSGAWAPTRCATTRDPFDHVLSATAVAAVLQSQGGGRFVHLRPRTDGMGLPANVELLYSSFSLTTSRNDNPVFTRWWYDEYLPAAIGGAIRPTPVEKRDGGLRGL